jgi:hypothetical protein
MRLFRRAVAAGLLSVSVFAGSLVLASAPALGFFYHPFLVRITEAHGAPLGDPLGLAFDSKGNLFVLDASGLNPDQAYSDNGLVVDVFSSTNTFASQFPVIPNEFKYGRSIGVSDTTGDVYVLEQGAREPGIEVFKPEGGGEYALLQKRPVVEGSAVWLAVDNSSGPHRGDVYVGGEGERGVDVIDTNAEGVLEETAEELPQPPEGFSLGGPGSLSEAGLIAIDNATGEVYIANPGKGVVDEYNADDEYQGRLTGPPGSFEPKGVAVEESTGDIYVLDGANDVVDQFDASGKYVGIIDQTPAGTLSVPWDVAVNASGDVYVSDSGGIDIFEPTTVSVPYASTGAASVALATRTTAKLEGVANPEGEEVTSCQFEYGTSTSYGHTAACVPAPGSGSSPVKVSAEVSGLAVETTYHYRLVMGNKNGLDPGLDGTFTTYAAVPELTTEEATNIEQPAAGANHATLHGRLAPDGADTHYYFEYGETEAYGLKTPEVDGGSESELKHFQEQITGLKSATTYHFRIVATNTFGTNTGADTTFTTLPAVPDLQTEAATNIELSGTKVVATLHGSLAPNGADTHYYFEYGETTAYGSVSPALPGANAGEAFKLESAHVQLAGLKPYALYHFRLAATNAFGTTTGADMIFFTAGVVPPIVIGGLPASSVSQFAATLNGTLETSEEEANYHFEYGTTAAYGQIAPTPDNYAPVTSETLTLSQPIVGLQAGTTYHYRLIASSPGGTNVTGPDETFTTLPIPAPTVATGAAEGVGVGTATLNGTVDPHGWDTTYLFEYGTSTAYGQSWPTVEVDMGALEGSQPVVVNVPNLLPSTTYHYRLVATNGGGTSYGPDMTFTTGEYPAQVIQEPVVLRTLLVPTSGETATPSGKKSKKSKKSKKGKKAKPRAKHGKSKRAGHGKKKH